MDENIIHENGKECLTYWPYCLDCKEPYKFDSVAPFAYCNCGTSEWGDPRPASFVNPPTNVIKGVYLKGSKFETIHHPNSCLNKAVNEEPIFVLRAKDPVAPIIVREWVKFCSDRVIHEEKWDEALEVAEAMEIWRGKKSKH